MSEPRQLNINGQQHTVDAPDDMPLLWVLRDLPGLTGPKFGCGIAQCGPCTVHLEGKPVQVILAGVDRATPHGALHVPGFGTTYSDTEIAAVANYVTARFGTRGSALGESQVAALRGQSQQ
jgi:isoquinoline 1-oxidoreductase alpha subunit